MRVSRFINERSSCPDFYVLCPISGTDSARVAYRGSRARGVLGSGMIGALGPLQKRLARSNSLSLCFPGLRYSHLCPGSCRPSPVCSVSHRPRKRFFRRGGHWGSSFFGTLESAQSKLLGVGRGAPRGGAALSLRRRSGLREVARLCCVEEALRAKRRSFREWAAL